MSHCRCHLIYRYLSLINGRTITSAKPSRDVKESTRSGGEDALTGLFVCSEDGCTKKFNTHSLVLCHLDCGKHQYTIKGNMPIYNPPNRFCGLLLDKMITWYKWDDGYQTVSAIRFDIRRPILFRRKKDQERRNR